MNARYLGFAARRGASDGDKIGKTRGEQVFYFRQFARAFEELGHPRGVVCLIVKRNEVVEVRQDSWILFHILVSDG